MERLRRWLPVMLVVLAVGCTDGTRTPEAPDAAQNPSGSPEGAPAPVVEVRDELAEMFAQAGVEGTFVLYDVTADRLVVAEEDRAAQPFVPASTYKIPHSLIALETGAVADEHEVIPYGGQPQPFQEWERDMDLREAVQASNAAIFQQVARRIGAEAEREWMARLGYGNAQVGSAVDRFWLDGPLMISAIEQARWLARLAQLELAASAAHQETVTDILRMEQTADFTLYGKTGWVLDTVPQIGWWVGWVQRGPDLYCFALNMDILSADDAAARVPLGRDLLSRLAVLPAGGSASSPHP